MKIKELLKNKLAEYRRLIWTLSKPSKEKIKEEFKINLIGITALGITGFLIQLLFQFTSFGIASLIIAMVTFIIFKSLGI